MNKELARIIAQSSSEDLSEAQRTIGAILETRRNKAKEEAWNKLRNAIKDYIATFGYIEIYDSDDDITLYLTALEDYSTNGEIKLNFE